MRDEFIASGCYNTRNDTFQGIHHLNQLGDQKPATSHSCQLTARTQLAFGSHIVPQAVGDKHGSTNKTQVLGDVFGDIFRGPHAEAGPIIKCRTVSRQMKRF
jgi:hypothetical protein